MGERERELFRGCYGRIGGLGIVAAADVTAERSWPGCVRGVGEACLFLLVVVVVVVG